MARNERRITLTYLCIGSGEFSMAIASLLSNKKENHVIIWTHDLKFKSNGYKKYSFIKKEKIKIMTDLSQAVLLSDVLFILVASPFIKSITEQLKKIDISNKPILIGTKGILDSDPIFLSEYIKTSLKTDLIGVFGGPNLAKDLQDRNPSSMTIASKKKSIIKTFVQALPNYINITTTNEPISVELPNAMKNIYAIGAGIFKNKSQSTNLAYLGMAYEEMVNSIKTLYPLDADSLPVSMLADFFLTGTMQESRNLHLGKLIGQKKSIQTYLKTTTVEGYNSLKIIYDLFQKKHIKAPILEALEKIIYHNQDYLLLEDLLFTRKED